MLINSFFEQDEKTLISQAYKKNRDQYAILKFQEPRSPTSLRLEQISLGTNALIGKRRTETGGETRKTSMLAC